MSNDTLSRRSTTVEIILYYLTRNLFTDIDLIYNSRNYSILLNFIISVIEAISTTVEIILYYLTLMPIADIILSTTVEIILYYLTPNLCICTIFLEPSNFIFIILYNICTIYVK